MVSWKQPVVEEVQNHSFYKIRSCHLSRSCHFSFLNFQGLCFNSFGVRLWAPALRKSPIIFKRMYLQKVGAHHFLEEFGWAHVPWDSYRILLYIYYWGSNILEIGCAYVDIFWKKHVCFFWAHPMSSYEIPFSRDLIRLPFSREIKKQFSTGSRVCTLESGIPPPQGGNLQGDSWSILFIFFFAINYLVHTLTLQNLFSVAPKRSKLPVPDAIDTKVCSTTQTTRSTGIAAPRAAGRKSLEVATCDSSLRASGHVIYDACWIQQKHSKARCNGERWNSPHQEIMVSEFQI